MRSTAWVTRSRRLAETWEPERTLRSGTRRKCPPARALGKWTPRTLAVTGGLRPTPLPSLKRRPCCPGKRCRCRAGFGLPLPPCGCDFSRRAVAWFASPQTWKPWSPTGFCNAFRRCSSREAPRSVIYTVALLEECNSEGGVGRKSTGALWVCCANRGKLVDSARRKTARFGKLGRGLGFD